MNRKFAVEIMNKVMEEKFFIPSDKSCHMVKGEKALLAFLNFQEDKVTAGDISKKLGVSTARIAFALNCLERKKLIKRMPDEGDKRKTYVCITDLGKKLVKKDQELILHDIEVVIEKIGEKKIREHIMLMSEIKQIVIDEHKKREAK